MSNFPVSLDNLSETTPIGGNPPTTSLGAQHHSSLHREIHAILNDLEAKLGIDASAVTTSHDYKLSAITGVNRALGRTEAATMLNKVIDGDDNTLQDIALASLKTILADASKFIVRDAAGTVVSSKAVPVGDVVGTTDQQIQVLPRLDQPRIGDFSFAGHSHTNAHEAGRLGGDAFSPHALPSNLLEFGLAYQRQGGVAGDGNWATSGTTNVDVSDKKVIIQCGAIAVTADPTVVTFPKPFAFTPLVIPATASASSVNTFTELLSSSATGFTLRQVTDAGGASTTEIANWIAIGQIAQPPAPQAGFTTNLVYPRRRDRRFVIPTFTTGKLS